MPKVKGGPQFEPRCFSAADDLVTDVHSVLQMRQEHALLDDQIAHVITPDRQPIFEPEFAQVFRAMQIELAARAFQVLFEPTSRVPGEAVAEAAAASAAVLAAGITAPQVHHGYDLATWDVIRWALGKGFAVRVGLEDTTVLPDGSTATGNGDLVAAAVQLAANPAS